jgi:hypothetical protein
MTPHGPFTKLGHTWPRRILVGIGWLVAASLCSASLLLAQAPPRAVGPDSMPRTVADAEALGRLHPPARPGPASGPHPSWTGTDARQCVMSTGQHFVRSGEIVAGPFTLGTRRWSRESPKLGWAPVGVVHPDAEGEYPRLQVLAAPVAGNSPGLLFEATGPAFSVPDSTLFYPSRFALPASGEWILVAMIGDSWGCFTYRMP